MQKRKSAEQEKKKGAKEQGRGGSKRRRSERGTKAKARTRGARDAAGGAWSLSLLVIGKRTLVCSRPKNCGMCNSL